MGAVTYPSHTVADILNEHFVAVRINTDERSAGVGQLLRTYRLLWEPGFVFFDHRQTELRRTVGFCPPADFIGELKFVLGLVDMLYRRYDESFTWFRAAADQHPPPAVAAEALYWAGIAIYRREGKDRTVLKAHWERLRKRFPSSLWWTKADVFGIEGRYGGAVREATRRLWTMTLGR